MSYTGIAIFDYFSQINFTVNIETRALLELPGLLFFFFIWGCFLQQPLRAFLFSQMDIDISIGLEGSTSSPVSMSKKAMLISLVESTAPFDLFLMTI